MKRFTFALAALISATPAHARLIGASCPSRPVVCDSNGANVSQVSVASSPSCSSQTITITINDTATVLTGGTDFTGSTQTAVCQSLAGALLTVAGVQNSTCLSSGVINIYPDPNRVQYWTLATGSSSCATVTTPSQGQVQIGSTIFTDGGNGVLTAYQLNGTTLASLTTGPQTNGAETVNPVGAAAMTITGAAAQNGIVYTGTAPASVAGSGTNAGTGISWTAAAGGATSGTTGQTAGNGEGWSVTAGTGGAAPSGSTNGNGGSLTFIPGAAGGGAGSAGSGGAVVLKAPAASFGTVLSVQQSTGTANLTVTDAGVETATGVINANGGIDRSTAAALAIGATNATTVNIGATATPVAITSAGALSSPNSVLSSSATGGVGYKTGAGCSVTQGTNRTTGVTCNGTTGQITMFSAAGSATAATFTVSDTSIGADDTVVYSEKTGTNLYEFFTTAVSAATSFNVTFLTTGGTSTDAPVVNFAILKGSHN